VAGQAGLQLAHPRSRWMRAAVSTSEFVRLAAAADYSGHQGVSGYDAESEQGRIPRFAKVGPTRGDILSAEGREWSGGGIFRQPRDVSGQEGEYSVSRGACVVMRGNILSAEGCEWSHFHGHGVPVGLLVADSHSVDQRKHG
jgi:hypothetical protein